MIHNFVKPHFLCLILSLLLNTSIHSQSTSSYESVLKEIDSLNHLGKYQEGLKMCNTYIKLPEVNDNDSLRIKFLYAKLRQVNFLGDQQRVITLGDSIVKTLNGFVKYRLRIQMLICGGFLRTGNFQGGIDIMKDAIDVRLKQEEGDPLYYFYHNIGLCYLQLEQFDSAQFFLEKDLQLKMKVLQKNDPQIAQTYSMLGMVCMKTGKTTKAVEYSEGSVKTLIGFYGAEHPQLLIPYYSLSTVYVSNSSFSKAELFLRKALYIYESNFKNQVDERLLAIYNQLSYISIIKLEYDKAIHYGKKNLEAFALIGDRINSSEKIGTYDKLARAYSMLGNYEEAMNYLVKAKEIAEQMTPRLHSYTAAIYKEIGLVFTEQNKLQEALINFKQYYQEALLQAEPGVIAEALHMIGKAEENLGNLNQALLTYTKGYEQYKNTEYAYYFSNGLVRIYVMKGLLAKAQTQLLKSAKELNYDLNDPFNFDRSNNLQILIEHLNLRRFYYENQLSNSTNYKDSIAINYSYQLAAIEKEQQSLSTMKSKDFHNDNTYKIFEESIDFFSKNQLENSFSVAERSKKALFRENIYNATNNSFSDSLLKEDQKTRKLLSACEKEIFEQQKLLVNDSLISILEDSLFRLKEIQDRLRTEIKEKNPSYYNTNYAKAGFSVKQCQEILSGNESLLEFFVGDSAIYAFVVNENSFHQTEIPLDFALEETVESLRKSIVIPDSPKNTFSKKQYISTANQLYQKLIAPLSKYLKEEVIVVADGVLNFVPFEALLTETVDESSPYSEMPYWINEKLISYQFSANQMYQLEHRQRKTFKKEVGVFAPLYTVNKDKLLEQYADYTSFRFELGPLKYNKEEAESIDKILGADLYLDSLASKAVFLKQANNYSILHLAAHGRAYRDNGKFSYLAFSNDTTQGELENMLFVEDLYNTTLNNELVVLSACETGIGELKKGSGVVSLSKGLAFAGVRSQLATLWKIDDQSTGVFMPDFYKNLKEGMRKHEALRAVKQSFIKNEKYAAPFFWAAYTINGDTSPINNSGNSLLIFLFALIALLALFLIMYQRKKAN